MSGDQQSSRLKLHSQQQKIMQIKAQLNLISKLQRFEVQFLQQIKCLKQKIQVSQSKIAVKSMFTNVNAKFQQLYQQIEQSKQKLKKMQKKQIKQQQNNSQSLKNTKCKQTSHLRQIFVANKKGSTMKKLLQKRESLYQKIQANLSKQEPYIWQKVLERIKRIAKYKSRLSLNDEINKKIKLNQDWIKKQTLKLQNNLIEKEIQENCVANLNNMKTIMTKKVNINDYIYQKVLDANKQKTSMDILMQKVKRIREEKIKEHQQQIQSGSYNGK